MIFEGELMDGVSSYQLVYIDTNTFKPKIRTQSKHELGYKEMDFIVFFIGKMHLYKDSLTLIKATSEAIEKNASLHLTMIGYGACALFKQHIYQYFARPRSITIAPNPFRT